MVDSFQLRVKKAIKGKYRSRMWLSLQAAVLYETDRGIRHHYPRIGQSQKKVILYDNAMKLIDTFDFLNNDNRAEIRFHKKHLKEPLTSDLAWKRLNTISARLNETILPKAKELIEIGYSDNNSHEDFCEILLQTILEENNDSEFNHKNFAFIIYRIYFRGVTEDPDIFTPSAVSDDCRVDENPSINFDESVVLTIEQQQQFIDEGYVHLKQVVPDELVYEALAAINVALCEPRGEKDDDEKPGILNLQRYHIGLGTSDAIMNILYKSPVWILAQRLLGKGNIMNADRGQIALRPPNLDLMNKKKEGSLPPIKSWHIDGEGISLLVGITLSDALEPYSGNLCVYPGSHRKTLPWVKEQKHKEIMIQKPDLADGIPILAKAGDVVLAHQKTAHKGMENASHEIRYQVYFRLKHKDHQSNLASGKWLENLWVEYDGLSDDLLC